MLKMTIDNEEVVSNKDFTIKEEMLSASSVILNNVYPKSWENDHDYINRFYYPKDYSKLNIQNFAVVIPGEAGNTVSINESATLNDVDASKNSRVFALKGNTKQDGTPTPDNPVPVNVVSGNNSISICGKNLFDLNKKISSVAFDNDTNKIVANSYFDIYYIPVVPNTTYVSSANLGTSSGNIAYAYCNEIPQINTLVTGRTTTDVSILNNGTFTAPSNVKYLLIRIGKSNQILTNWQIEVGNQATTYEPYTSNTYPINLGSIELCKIDTYQDYIFHNISTSPYYDDTLTENSWYLHKATGKIVYNGSENWSMANNGNNTYRFYVAKPSNSSSPCLSQYFEYSTNYSAFDNKVYIGSTNLIISRVIVNNSYINELTAFQNWLSTHNTIVYYVLATPTNTEITNTTLLNQLNALESS